MIYPDLVELCKLQMKAQTLSGLFVNRAKRGGGVHISRLHGKGIEFDEVRQYEYGDEIRHIDWRVTAKKGKPHIKLFREERGREIILCIDMNLNTRFGTRGTFKSVQIARAAALLGWCALKQGDLVGAMLFGQVPGRLSFAPPAKTNTNMLRLLKTLCNHETYNHGGASLTEALTYLRKKLTHGSVIFLLADFSEVSLQLVKDITYLAKYNDLILLPTYDPADEFMPAIGPIRFAQLGEEDRRDLIMTNDREGSSAYRSYWLQESEKLHNLSRKLGLRKIVLRTDGDVYTSLYQVPN
jgi:uncharacterized protein (DUF58 family)